ncbi:hypothetical protein [Delftia tsuruhatensis]|uniref:hypothetical protein n=1 Tax=Delftia tsuruhatensis TaxID=180282 RepID=UPI001969B0D6|nr:hypothetical protein [Delftia tsuruhatensis]
MTDCPRIASSPAMCVASVVLPAPPFWLSKAMIMARPSKLESWPALALQSGVVLGFWLAALFAFWRLSTETARFY